MAVETNRQPIETGVYTVAEAAFIAEIDERFVAGEIEAGIIPAAAEKRLKSRLRVIGKEAVFYVSAVKPYRRHMDRALRTRVWQAVNEAVTDHKTEASLGFLSIDLLGIGSLIEPRLHQVDRLRSAVTQDPRTCSGEPVLRGTRHRVHQIAELIRQGVALGELCDELGLSPDEIDTALLYDRLHPRVGRPPSIEGQLKNIVDHVPDHR